MKWIGRCVRANIAAAVFFIVPTLVVGAPLTPEQAARLVVGVARIDEVLVSPRGDWVTYQISRKNPDNDQIEARVWLQSLADWKASVAPAEALPDGISPVVWAPDNRLMVWMDGRGPEKRAENALYDPKTGSIARLSFSDSEFDPQKSADRPRITSLSYGAKWSSQGHFLAFLSQVKAPNFRFGARTLDSRKGVPLEKWRPSSYVGPSYGLFVLDIASGNIRRLTPDTMSVLDFSWSPDETELAIEAQDGGDRDSNYGINRSHLWVVSRIDKTIRPLTVRRGIAEVQPAWSPDGRWIAFKAFDNEMVNTLTATMAPLLSIVPAAGGGVRWVARDRFRAPHQNTEGQDDGLKWAADSKSFIYRGLEDFQQVSVRVDVATLSAERLSRRKDSGALYYERQVVSDVGRLAVFSHESSIIPPELFASAVDSRGNLVGPVRQLSHVNSGFPMNGVHLESVAWPSADGKFTLIGLLFTPENAWKERNIAKPLPAIISLRGGPGAITSEFGGELGREIALALRGYAVLVPYTRGREGRDDSLRLGIRDSRSAFRVPFENDVMTGVDMLVRKGIADPDRLGLVGHSYGGGLTAYGITRTSRFKAAVDSEGTSSLLDNGIFASASGKDDFALTQRDMAAIFDIYDSLEQHHLVEESPLFNAGKIKTPMLLLFGVHASAERSGIPIYKALKHFGRATAMFVYDSGHGPERPLESVDYLTRIGEWFDYWVRGMPYPDPQRAGEYEAYKQANR